MTGQGTPPGHGRLTHALAATEKRSLCGAFGIRTASRASSSCMHMSRIFFRGATGNAGKALPTALSYLEESSVLGPGPPLAAAPRDWRIGGSGRRLLLLVAPVLLLSFLVAPVLLPLPLAIFCHVVTAQLEAERPQAQSRASGGCSIYIAGNLPHPPAPCRPRPPAPRHHAHHWRSLFPYLIRPSPRARRRARSVEHRAGGPAGPPGDMTWDPPCCLQIDSLRRAWDKQGGRLRSVKCRGQALGSDTRRHQPCGERCTFG